MTKQYPDGDGKIDGRMKPNDESFELKQSAETVEPTDGKAFLETLGPTSISPPTTADVSGPSQNQETLDIVPNGDVSQANATQDFMIDSEVTAVFVSGSQSNREADRASIPKRIGGYEIKRVLGRGGMGIVYKAKQEKLGRIVALKMVLAGVHASSEQLDRFIAEAKAVAHLQHPNIVQIFEVGEHENLPFFSLEFVDGESLDKRLAGKPLAPMDAARLLETISRAMQYAHDHGILHRDLKPANVLLSLDGTPKVMDFGLAKRLDDDANDSASTRTGTIMGTPSYMSPEQASGSVHELGPATDQYSLGAMLYEFLTGRPPFLAAKPIDTILKVLREEPIAPRQLQSNLPVDLETICLKALQKEPANRYLSCNALADDLGRFIRGEPILARPIGNFERVWRWCRRNPLVASLSTSAAIALLAVAVVSTWSSIALSNKNLQLAKSNEAIHQANTELTKTNQELDASNTENIRRSERLQKYVQEIFREVNKLNLTENPRIRDFKEKTLSKTFPLIDEFTRELPEGGQGVPTKMSGLFELSQSYKDQGLGLEAERTLEEYIRLARERVEFQKGSDASRGNLLLGLKELSLVRLELNRDVHASLEALHEASGLAELMVHESKAAPNGLGVFPRYRSEILLAEIHHLIGVAIYRSGDSLSALKHYDQSIAIRRKVLDDMRDGSAFKDPTSTNMTDAEKGKLLNDMSSALSIGRLAQAAAFNRCGKSSDAETIFQAALEQTEKKFASDSSNPLQLRLMIGVLGTWGEFLAWNSRSDEALAHFKRAAELSDVMLSKNSESTELKRAAATAYYRYAQWLMESSPEKSADWGKKSLQLRQAAAALEPKNDRRQMEWMVSLSRFGEVAEASKIAEHYLQANTRDSEMLTEIAQALTQCSVRASGEEKDSLEQRAIKAIQDAVSLGFRDAIVLESNIDYKPLRSNPMFQSLVASLKAANATHP